MAQNNSQRISHKVESLPNTFRDDQLFQIINDLDEENSGLGYSQIIRSGVFVDSIVHWEDNTQQKKRYQVDFFRTGAFIDSLVKYTYDEEDDSIVVATTTVTLTRTATKSVSYADIVVTRP